MKPSRQAVPALLAVPAAAIAAALTRWPSVMLGSLATIAAIAWVVSVVLAPSRPRLYVVGPAAALLLLLIPTAPDAFLPVPGWSIGIAVGFALIASLPPRHAGTKARTGLGVWIPMMGVVAVLLIPLLLPMVFGPNRLASMIDRASPALLLIIATLLGAAAIGIGLLRNREVTV